MTMTDQSTIADKLNWVQEWMLSGLCPSQPVVLNDRVICDAMQHFTAILSLERLDGQAVADVEAAYGAWGWIVERSGVL